MPSPWCGVSVGDDGTGVIREGRRLRVREEFAQQGGGDQVLRLVRIWIRAGGGRCVNMGTSKVETVLGLKGPPFPG